LWHAANLELAEIIICTLYSHGYYGYNNRFMIFSVMDGEG
jgi:hypothetical protein